MKISEMNQHELEELVSGLVEVISEIGFHPSLSRSTAMAFSRAEQMLDEAYEELLSS